MKKTTTKQTDMMSRRDADICSRVLLAIWHQIDVAYRENRKEDACALARLTGALSYHMFGAASRSGDSPFASAKEEATA